MIPFSRIYSGLRSLFLQGLFTLLPLTATVMVVHITYQLIARWIAPIKHVGPGFLQNIPGAEFIIVFTIILTLGAFLNLFILTPVVHRLENLINRLPLIRIIYSSAKILVDFFNEPNPTTVEKQVVLVEFPRKGTYNIAFLLGSAEGNFSRTLPEEKQKKAYSKVFMPNSPNPTSGYFFILPDDEIISTDITFEEAIKTIVSCGIHTPESLMQQMKHADKKEEEPCECSEISNKNTN